MTSEALREFGYRVRDARIRKGWTLEQLAAEALANPERKGYVSQIENGKRPLSARTIGNLARVLDLPEAVTRPLLFAPAAEDEVTPEDRLAETLIRRNDADPAPPQAEALVIALAYEFAGGKFLDLATAYTGLRNALQAAAEMRAELDRLHNLDDRLAAVLRRVADLNDRGDREAAGEALEAAIKAKEAELEGLHEAALKQDRLRNRPEAAAARLIARLKAAAPPGGVFNATQRLINETRERGEAQGDPFDLAVALELAKANLARAKPYQIAPAQNDLGNCHLAVGERQSGGGHLTRARKAFTEALRLTSRKADPQNWAGQQNNLGNALQRLGDRTADTDLLQQAVGAHRAALTVRTPEATPMDWAASQNNLGVALHTLGDRTADTDLLRQAVAAHRDALTVHTPEATPMVWAASQNNLGIALRTLAARTADADLLRQAVAAHRAALTVRTPEATPMDWATSQNNLGIALQTLGERSADAEHLQQAVAAHRAALTVRTPEDTPMDWAGSQNNLGVALRALGERTADIDLLRQAEAAQRAALTVQTPEATPMAWAGSQNNLGLALRGLGAVAGDAAALDAAAEAYALCLTQRPREAAPFLWAQTQWNLADLALARHGLAPDPALLAAARRHLALAREVFAAEGNAHQLAECDRLEAEVAARGG